MKFYKRSHRKLIITAAAVVIICYLVVFRKH